MRTRIGLALAIAMLLPASPAAASVIGAAGSTVTYTAAAGESNRALVSIGRYDTVCGTVGTPCLQVWDSGARITAATGGCIVTVSDPIVGDTAVCPLPSSVVANLGDRDDSYWDWDGPSVIDAGAGNDNPVFGAGGDDVIHGGIGSDLVYGQEGNDLVDGGPGDDYLEGVPCACVEEAATHGSDTYVGGGGNDSVTYEGRTENLSLSVDGVANDGAPGENDNIGADIGTVVGGHGSDTMTGNAGRNAFGGGEGDDSLAGLGSDDQLGGGSGNDRLDGGPGQDILGGDDGDDTLVGGEGVDRFWGDDIGACITYSCASGQDLIDARDGAREQVNCGPGTDSVRADADEIIVNWVDLSDQCESVDGLAAAGSGSGSGSTAPAFAVNSARVIGRRIVLKVTVPGPGVVNVRAVAGRLSVGSASRSVRAAGATTIRVKPSRAAARRHRLKVTVRVAFKPTSGTAPARLTRRVTLR